MTTSREATINLKTSFARRNSLLGKLRAQGTTMQSFLSDIMELADTDDCLFHLLQVRRMELGLKRLQGLAPSPPASAPVLTLEAAALAE